MKATSVVGVLLFSLLFGSAGVNATLLNLNNSKGDVIYDTISHDIWIQNLQTFNALSYEKKGSKISVPKRYSHIGINSWRLAPAFARQELWKNPAMEFLRFEHDYVFAGSRHFAGSYNAEPASCRGRHYLATAKDLCQLPPNVEKLPLDSVGTSDDFSIGSASPLPSAGVCADPPRPIPEPNSMLLFGTGLFVLVVYSKRVRNTVN